ncbi:hypothetical protein KJ836_01285 [Patescibacteria group bacterium]|nr:hypothetical protein [Patescibacteria group bacterium]
MEENQSDPILNHEPEQNLSDQPDEVTSAEVVPAPMGTETEERIELVQPIVPVVASVGSNKMDADTKLFAALSYISVLFIIPWVTKKNNNFVSFHVKQGMALFVAEVVIWFILWLIELFLEGVFSYRAFGLVQFLYRLAWLVFGAVSILGVYHALTGKEKPLPYLAIITKNLKI